MTRTPTASTTTAPDATASSSSADVLAENADRYMWPGWGQGAIDVNEHGHAVVRLGDAPGQVVDLVAVTHELAARGIEAPVLLRFPSILRSRLARIRAAFDTAIAECAYGGRYRGVYPMKVNEQRQVVEQCWALGAEFDFGLEVGSKPELMVAMAITGGDHERPIICNGFKDDDYVELALRMVQLGRRLVLVIDRFAELDLILRHADRLGVEPRIGVRVKLTGTAADKGGGRWSESKGERSKFGLNATEVLRVVERLRAEDRLSCFELLHAHAGSQVEDIRAITDSIGQLARFYVELRRLGVPVRTLDVGGGLGVNYAGRREADFPAINYDVEEYALDLVHVIGTTCTEADVPHPDLVSESGRAMVAHMSVLVMDVLSSMGPRMLADVPLTDAERTLPEDAPPPLRDLLEAIDTLVPEKVVERSHDLAMAWEGAQQLFRLGYLRLEQLSLAERLYWRGMKRVAETVATLERTPPELEELDRRFAAIYFANFSLFQSLPDSWAVDQVHPIMPLQRLDERPSLRATLVDVTCDSDGKIDGFVDHEGVSATLEVHPLREGERYLMGVFLVGAYQETLGDLHNLFGDTNVAQIVPDEERGWHLEQVVPGDTVREVLGYVQYDVGKLQRLVREEAERAIRAGLLTPVESGRLVRLYRDNLEGTTYLESAEDDAS